MHHGRSFNNAFQVSEEDGKKYILIHDEHGNQKKIRKNKAKKILKQFSFKDFYQD